MPYRNRIFHKSHFLMGFHSVNIGHMLLQERVIQSPHSHQRVGHERFCEISRLRVAKKICGFGLKPLKTAWWQGKS